MPRPCYPPAALLALLLTLTANVAAAAPITLDEAIALALENANEMVQAREDVVLVDADYLTALSTILPRVDITARGGEAFFGHVINEQRNPRPGALIAPDQPVVFTVGPFNDFRSNNFSQPSFGLGVTARQLIYDGGRWWTQIEQVGDRRVQQNAVLQRIQDEVRERTTRRFYELAKTAEALSAIVEHVSVGRAQLERAKALLEAGRATSRDVATAVRDLAADEIILEERRVAVANAVTALNIQLGRRPNIEVTPVLGATVTTTVGFVLPPYDTLLDAALTHRPEIAQQRGAIEFATKDVDIQSADYYPQLTLEASYSKSSRRPDRVFGDPSENYAAALDLVMRWNVFEGLNTKARVQRASITLKKNLAELDDLMRRIEGDLTTRINRIRQLRRVLELSERGVSAAAEAVRLARGLFEAGRGTALERRDAEIQLTNARLEVINARYEFEIAKAELRRAIGVDLAEVR